MCIHPNDDIEKKRKYFPAFKVIKYQTRKLIQNSLIVTDFGSIYLNRQNGVEPRIVSSRNVGGFSIQQGTMDFTKISLWALKWQNIGAAKRVQGSQNSEIQLYLCKYDSLRYTN